MWKFFLTSLKFCFYKTKHGSHPYLVKLSCGARCLLMKKLRDPIERLANHHHHHHYYMLQNQNLNQYKFLSPSIPLHHWIHYLASLLQKYVKQCLFLCWSESQYTFAHLLVIFCWAGLRRRCRFGRQMTWVHSVAVLCKLIEWTSSLKYLRILL